MALEGYLEDIGVCDILQLLSLSKKSGFLELTSRHGDGAIMFHAGTVIRASSGQFPDELGQLLVRDGVVTAGQVEDALDCQRQGTDRRPLGPILADRFGISPGLIERAVEKQIERIVFSFFAWQEGTFVFRPGETQHVGEAAVNPLDFMLEKGLSPKRLALKGRQVLDRGDDAVDDALIDREVSDLESKQRQRGIDLLRGMLAELECPEFCGGIILLILRYASELMERAVIFDVRGRTLVGVGQFGLDAQSGCADRLVRALQLTAEPGSLFEHVLNEKKAVVDDLKATVSEERLKSLLPGASRKCLLAPLINDGDVVALLYGDRLLKEAAPRSREAFEVFLSQAGLALEQALLGTEN